MDPSATDIPAAIEWHEGMMLAPQHFQVSDRRHEMLQAYHAHRIQPFYWGIQDVDFDDVLLAEGTCRVLSLDALLPDGTPVTHTSGTAHDLDLDLSDLEDDAREAPVTIYAAVPARTAASGDGSVPDRYRSVDGTPVTDAATGTGSLRIPRRVPHVQLLASDPPPSQYVSLPIAAVRYTDDGFSRTSYVPPRLNVPLKSKIGKLCRSVVREVREKARALVNRVQSTAVEPGSMAEMATKRKIQALASGLPSLEAQLRSERVHPFALYTTLCQMAGHLAGLTHRMVPPPFSTYDHEDLRANYVEVITYIARALTEGVQETYVPIPFRQTDGGFALTFDDDWRQRDLVLGIRGRPERSEDDTRRWGARSIIGSTHRIDAMRERRILGVDRTPIEQADNLVPTQGTVLFRIDADSEYIEEGEDLVVRRGEERDARERPLELTLYVREDSP